MCVEPLRRRPLTIEELVNPPNPYKILDAMEKDGLINTKIYGVKKD